MKITVDGNTAASKVAYKLTEVACIYPITPSSPMAELADEMSNSGEKNIFGNVVEVVEMQSEAGAAGALHGAMVMGALGTTFTSSQGLLLMIPNMYKMAGELLPTVFHVSARSLASHALSIFGDHSDVMSVRSTGFNMLVSNTVQETLDMALIAHTAAIRSSLPFIHFFDGFRTSHEIQKIDNIEDFVIEKMTPYNEIQNFKQRALDPSHPHQQGTAENPDIFFQHREAINIYYDKVFNIVNEEFEKFEKLTGRHYAPFEYVGPKNPTAVIAMMGSGANAMEEVVRNESSVGLIKVRLYRPFNAKAFLDILPKSVKLICALDRTKESGAVYEPLAEDILSSLNGNNIKVIGGRYGLGGKDFTPKMAAAVIKNCLKDNPKDHFTVGITDDVTFTSLQLEDYNIADSLTYEMLFYGLGSDGTVSANKNSIKIIGNNTKGFVQGYFEYDSKKSGSLTKSHLRISDKPILSSYLVESADFIAIHNYSFVARYENILDKLKQNGTVLLNTILNEKELNEHLPIHFKQLLKKKNAKLYIINARKYAREFGLRDKINVIMQSAFFKLTNFMPYEKAKEEMKKAAYKTYGKKGDAVVESNYKAIDSGENLIKINIENINLETSKKEESKQTTDEYYNKIMKPIERLEGESLPSSAFSADGHFPTDTSKFEKRGIAASMPKYICENCIQCGQCIIACPHSALRPVLATDENLKNAPEGFKTKPAIGVKDNFYRVQVSPLDCTGCGVCANVCPAKQKALVMEVAKDFEEEKINYNYSKNINMTESPFARTMVKGLQFNKSYFEFPGACAGCGETPYIKIATQLFGKNMVIANATGCSSIYAGSAPACPYSKDNEGHGPAWANSLFEDNAEFGMGMSIANRLNGNKSGIWIIGGDGWAYDIGYGGLDHLLASKENVNILVLDSEVYSNTGGQASKSTPKGGIAKFAAGGKKTKKKNLALMAMSYENCYVAQVSLGADMNQCIKAMVEAERFDGPSLIIAYSPCVNHGFNLAFSQEEMKRAVQSGYWSLFRYSPDQGVIMDSGEPTMSYEEFLMGETRYSSLAKTNPETAKRLFEESALEAKQRIEAIKKYIKKEQ